MVRPAAEHGAPGAGAVPEARPAGPAVGRDEAAAGQQPLKLRIDAQRRCDFRMDVVIWRPNHITHCDSRIKTGPTGAKTSTLADLN